MNNGELPLLSVRAHSGMSVQACVELARLAEENDLHALWFAENPYERGVLPAASACALATSRLVIGIGVFNPFNRHPTLMAMEMGALDELSGGRAILGIGSGVPAWVNRIVPHHKPITALRDSVIIARDLLAGREVNYRGEVFSASGVRLGYPLQRGQVPVYLAAMAPKSLQLCGELGDGLIIGNMCPPAYTRVALAQLAEGARRAGRELAVQVVKYVPCAVSTSRAEAHDHIKPAIARMLHAYSEAYLTQPAVIASITAGSGIEPERFQACMQRLAAGDTPQQALDEAFVAAYSIAGTAEECLEQCRALRAGGVGEVAVSFAGDAPRASVARLRAALSA